MRWGPRPWPTCREDEDDPKWCATHNARWSPVRFRCDDAEKHEAEMLDVKTPP